MKFPRDFYRPKNATKIADKLSSAVAYIYESDGRNGRVYGVVAFHGKADKPDFHYTYRKPEARNAKVTEFFKAWQERDARMQQRREVRKSFVPNYKVGDIFHTSWGYDQTNVEYFQIIETRGKFAILREIAKESVETGFMQGKCVPVPDKFLSPRHAGDDQGVPIRRLMQDGHIKIDDVRSAWPIKPTEIAGVRVYDSTRWSSYA